MPRRARHPHRQTLQSNTYRFFVEPSAFRGRDVLIENAELTHQLGNVLRLRAGERVLLLDNSGWQYVVTLSQVEPGRVAGIVERKELAGGEPRTKLTLYVALMRPERFEWVLQKGTELGVSAFVPLICERSTIADAGELSERKLDRWGRIVREAAEQARRGKVPRLAPALLFPTACDQAVQRGLAILLWEGMGTLSLRRMLREPTGMGWGRELGGQKASAPDRSTSGGPAPAPPGTAVPRAPFSVALFSGPEGGFTANEFETARRYGMITATLGPRTLRAETAPIVAASVILYEMGDLE